MICALVKALLQETHSLQATGDDWLSPSYHPKILIDLKPCAHKLSTHTFSKPEVEKRLDNSNTEFHQLVRHLTPLSSIPRRCIIRIGLPVRYKVTAVRGISSMEALSGAASVFAVVSLAIQIADSTKKLSEVWSSIKNVPQSIQTITQDLELVSSALEDIASG
ncbi:hypothetical protein B0J14DRAFT_372822 [Halenospora varia]|nr:hypothetical protein B0J14DRAFT_372822 [Halenospora varia]